MRISANPRSSPDQVRTGRHPRQHSSQSSRKPQSLFVSIFIQVHAVGASLLTRTRCRKVMRRDGGYYPIGTSRGYPPNFADHIQWMTLPCLSMMSDCHMMAQSIKAIMTAATVNATANWDSPTGSPTRRNDFIIGFSHRTHEPFLFWFIRPSCGGRRGLQVAALYRHFGKRRAKSSEKPSKL
jgi:hypothetical protein